MIRTGGGGNGVQVWVATAPVDMRKGFDGLAEVVRAFLGHDPLCGHLFVFRNRSSRRVKVLWWDKNGLAIYYKRLEKGAFAFPTPPLPGEKSVAVSAADLAMLLAGCPLQPSRKKASPAPVRHCARRGGVVPPRPPWAMAPTNSPTTCRTTRPCSSG